MYKRQTQDIRPLKIARLNLMPTKIATETQLARLLGNTPLQVELDLIQLRSHVTRNTSQEHMLAFYKPFDQIRGEKYDGMIITVAPVERMEFEQVDYWRELCEVMEWTKTLSLIHIYMCIRDRYLLALIIILLAVALLCVWRLWLADGEGGETAGSATPAPEITFEPVSPTPGTGATLGVSGGVDTVVYYQDNFGYLVPVLTSVPYEDGIAKATLSLMVASGPNDMQAARLGLRTVIPENGTMDLDLSLIHI